MASHILMRLIADPSLKPLRDVAVRPRALSYAAIIAGNTIAAAALSRNRVAEGSGDAIVSVGNLGDHIRMLNVATRLQPARPLRIIANDSAAGLSGIYPDVEIDASGGRYGAGFLFRSARRLGSRVPHTYARALVCQPMLTQPQAIAEAVTIADHCIALGDGIVDGVERVAFSGESWRTGYEDFFAACYPDSRFVPRPRIAAELAWTGRSSKSIAIHTGGAGHVRGIDANIFAGLAGRFATDGFVPVVIGAAEESNQLRAAFAGIRCEFALGLPIRDLAGVLANCAALCAIDSSVMNLADAIGVPSAIVYNLTDRDANGPYYVPVTPLYARGSRSFGATPHGRWKAAAKHCGDPPSVDDLYTAVAGLLALRATVAG